MKEWKYLFWLGGGAAALSLILGILVGNPLGVTVVRALIGGMGFALLGLGAFLVLRRFVPELFGAQLGDETGDETGGHVDIVMPEENPHLVGGVADDAVIVDAPVSEAEPVEGVTDTEAPAETLEPVMDAEPVEETEETVAPVETPAPVEGGDAGKTASLVPDGGESGGEESGGGQVLPEVDDAAFPVGPAGGPLDSLEAGGTPGGGGTVKIGEQEQDVETVAKAVRTMMNRDEKG